MPESVAGQPGERKTASSPASLPDMQKRQSLRRVLALLLLALGLTLLYDYPVYRPFLGGVLLLYGVLLLKWPHLWLALLPTSVPLLELAHWSGRFFIEDLDIVFLCTLALLLWRTPKISSQQPRSHLPFSFQLLILTLALSYLASLGLGLQAWPNWHDPAVVANFLGSANALRLFKGFFWALVFAPFVFQAFRDDSAQARKGVVGGMVAGALVIGAMAMWERGVWHALIYGRNVYQVLSPLLDFSTPYRVTGSFAEMHTGGEAIDGYLGLAWPMMVLALAMARTPWTLTLSSIALGGVLYSLVTTFSRGLYFSLALAGGIWLWGLLRVFGGRLAGGQLRHPALLLGLLGASAVLTGLAFSRGGMPGLASALLMVCLAAWLGWRAPQRSLVGALLLVAFCFFAWVAARGMVTSKWHPIEWPAALPWAVLLIGGAAVCGYFAGRRLPRDAGIKPYLVIALLLVAGVGTLAPALLGYRMTTRLSDVGADFATRAGHWQHVLSLKRGDWLDATLGMGLGSFPRAYHWDLTYPSDASGDFSLVREPGNVFLRTTGGKDLRMGQRVSVDAFTPMQLRLRVRTPAPEAWLKIRLCRRFVIHPSEWNSDCVTIDRTLTDTRGRWQNLTLEFDSGRVGDGLQWARAPLLLEIGNRREYKLMGAPPARIDIDDISLTDRNGNEHVANGGFEHGVDRWIPYYDFNHLPWHIKNLWLHLYFEQGALGVLAFAATWLSALALAWRASRRGDIFTVGLAAALTGFVAVGTFGSPIDAPRVAWLYYFLWFALLAQYRAMFPSSRPVLRRPTPSANALT